MVQCMKMKNLSTLDPKLVLIPDPVADLPKDPLCRPASSIHQVHSFGWKGNKKCGWIQQVFFRSMVTTVVRIGHVDVGWKNQQHTVFTFAPSTQQGLLLFWKIAGSSKATCVGVRSWKLGELFKCWWLEPVVINLTKDLCLRNINYIYIERDRELEIFIIWEIYVANRRVHCTECILFKFCQSTLRWSIKRTNSGCCMPNDDDIEEQGWRVFNHH